MLKGAIADTIAPLKGVWSVKWVRPENLHITLKFIGETPAERVSMIEGAMAEAVGDIRCFDVTLRGMGGFPNLSRPRVVWIGIDDGGAIGRIHGILDPILNKAGIRLDERPYSPHLTIGRSDGRQGNILGARGAALTEMTFGNFTVDSISLVKSVLLPVGPRYTTLGMTMLKA